MTNQLLNLDTLQHAKQKVIDLSVEFGPKALTALLIMVVGFFVRAGSPACFKSGSRRWNSSARAHPHVAAGALVVMGMFVVLALQNWAFN